MANEESKRYDGTEAIGIMTPSGDHYKIAKICINKSKHIFIEQKELKNEPYRRSNCRSRNLGNMCRLQSKDTLFSKKFYHPRRKSKQWGNLGFI